jgi:hydrogenase maturation protease
VANGTPGTIHRLLWPNARLEKLGTGSSHALGAVEALRLAEALGQLPDQVVIFGIEIAAARPVGELSPRVAAAICVLTRRIEDQIAE